MKGTRNERRSQERSSHPRPQGRTSRNRQSQSPAALQRGSQTTDRDPLERSQTQDPANYRPKVPKDLIGKAGQLAAAVMHRATSIKHDGAARFKVLFHGHPGTGKTTIADMIAACLATERVDIETINGRNLTIEVVREWQRNNSFGSLFGGWKVKVINEMDLVPAVAQDLMLTYLDDLAPRTAVIGTSNENIVQLTARFQSRFQCVNVPVPAAAEIAAWLEDKFKVARRGAKWIAETCCGNVRQALLDSASLNMTGILPEKLQLKPAVCASRSEAAKRAWDTMRNKIPLDGVTAAEKMAVLS